MAGQALEIFKLTGQCIQSSTTELFINKLSEGVKVIKAGILVLGFLFAPEFFAVANAQVCLKGGTYVSITRPECGLAISVSIDGKNASWQALGLGGRQTPCIANFPLEGSLSTGKDNCFWLGKGDSFEFLMLEQRRDGILSVCVDARLTSDQKGMSCLSTEFYKVMTGPM